MPTRREVMAGAAVMLGGCAGGSSGRGGGGQSAFVSVDGQRFLKGGRPYRYVGANIWYGAYLGADAPYGNRDRLRRELDRLAALGIDNLRVLASSEESPLRGAISPSFRGPGDSYNEALLGGLDYLLAEMARRDMRAVLYLTNFWEWSGGMMTYLSWVNGGRYINMNDPAHPWPEFPNFNAAFYQSEQAIGLYHHYVRAVVGRTNSVTGRPYRDDPTIMSWQLANEPRPGGSEANGRPNLPAFYRWIAGTATLIKSIDPNHLVSTGSEGLKGCIEDMGCVTAAHSQPGIDYVTIHIWPQNWSWVDPADLAGTWPAGSAQVRDYIDRHVRTAREMNRPLVIEEFGFPRDGGSFDPGATTAFKDRFYRLIYEATLASAREGGPIQGTNFWAWNGEGRAHHADHRFRPGDLSYLGDPPHEPQGWYGVFDRDDSTHAVIRDHGAALRAV